MNAPLVPNHPTDVFTQDEESRKLIYKLLSHPSDKVTEEKVESVFTFHPPTEQQKVSYRSIRFAAMEFARVVLANTPNCADQAASIRKIREAVMTANASIALSSPVPADLAFEEN